MHSIKKSKFLKQRPGSSARVYDTENSNYEKSRISRLPKRTYSLEGKKGHLSSRQSNKNESSTVSMIPRLEWKKGCKKDIKPSTAPVRHTTCQKHESPRNLNKKESPEPSEQVLSQISDSKATTEVTASCVESRLNENLRNFKNNVLMIPEYWAEAGHTVSSILKNAVNIVAKQYPNTDAEAFEDEIQNILKAAETVKHQILTKTEDIINQANKIYEKEGEPREEDEEELTQKIEELKDEVPVKKNAEELLKCGTEIRHLIQLNSRLKKKAGLKDNKPEVLEMEWEKKIEERRIMKRIETKKSKMVMESSPKDMRRQENVMQSCGDVLRKESGAATKSEIIPDESSQKKLQCQQEDKFTQTINLWTAELHRREEDLAILNRQVLELHQLCQDHISKFKNFNLQIKLRGICNKAQHTSVSKEIQILTDEKMQLAEKNNKLQYYSKDLETAIKKKNLDLYQKDKVIHQQKRLLHVRDELIEMLKTKCKVEVDKDS